MNKYVFLVVISDNGRSYCPSSLYEYDQSLIASAFQYQHSHSHPVHSPLPSEISPTHFFLPFWHFSGASGTITHLSSWRGEYVRYMLELYLNF